MAHSGYVNLEATLIKRTQILEGKSLSAIRAAEELGIHPISSGSISQGRQLSLPKS